jgi:hypothetical protein
MKKPLEKDMETLGKSWESVGMPCRFRKIRENLNLHGDPRREIRTAAKNSPTIL